MDGLFDFEENEPLDPEAPSVPERRHEDVDVRTARPGSIPGAAPITAAAGPPLAAQGITHTNPALNAGGVRQPAPDGRGESGLPDLPPDWQEVPQERFLSWTPAMQAAYCAARDAEAALGAETAEEAEWFINRSRMYREMMK